MEVARRASKGKWFFQGLLAHQEHPFFFCILSDTSDTVHQVALPWRCTSQKIDLWFLVWFVLKIA
jgi:hypothetical protein